MKEQDLIYTIQTVTKSDYIGDDCAYLKNIGIVVTQDSLAEGIHFKREWYTPKELGYKSVIVNISDIFASGAKPEYLTIGLSLPSDVNKNFVEDFYKGISEGSFGAKVIGGDITGSVNGIFISITAIGSDQGRRISSRKNAKIGYSIITTGNYGSSSAGLRELLNNAKEKEFVNYHKRPILNENFSRQIASKIDVDYAMMDTSDGLADALFKIAESSGVKIEVDYSKVPHLDDISREECLFGGEDYNLIAAVPNVFVENIDNAIVIGKVVEYDGKRLKIDEIEYSAYDELKIFNHFE